MSKIRTSTDVEANDLMDMIIYNDNENLKNCSYCTVRSARRKDKTIYIKGKPIYLDNMEDEFIKYFRNRSNSVELYKKHRKRKRLRKKKNQFRNNDVNINNGINKNINNNEIEKPIDDINKNNNNNNHNNIKGKKTKKVSFLNPEFVVIIDVESYKKFNEENTCKDPYDEYIKNNNINNNKENNKDKVLCSCFIM